MLEVENLICDYLEGRGQDGPGLDPAFVFGVGEWGSRGGWNGPSGSGKTTLFHCLAGLLTPYPGADCPGRGGADRPF